MTDQADNDQIYWDKCEQEAEARDMAIEGRKEALWQDKDAICRVIAENTGAIHNIYLTGYDVEKAIRGFIDKCFTVEAEADLNL